MGKTLKEQFEEFCGEYGLDYDFAKIGGGEYGDHETHKAFIIWRYSTAVR